MDATVEQLGGYRFVYTLPLTDHELLVEDTRYSNDPSMHEASDRDAIVEYARARGWSSAEIVREESGVLPITLAGDIRAHWARSPKVPMIGLRGAFFPRHHRLLLRKRG